MHVTPAKDLDPDAPLIPGQRRIDGLFGRVNGDQFDHPVAVLARSGGAQINPRRAFQKSA